MITNPNLLDRLAMYLLEDKNGQPRGFALQTVFDFVGIPTIMSIGDLLGILRGYLSLRNGFQTKGMLELITAIVPWVPTGPVHYAIEKMYARSTTKRADTLVRPKRLL